HEVRGGRAAPMVAPGGPGRGRSSRLGRAVGHRDGPVTPRVRAVLLGVPVAFLLVFFAYPFGAIVWRALVPDPGAFARILGQSRVHEVIWFTIWQAAASTALTMVIGLPIAYVVSRFAFRGRAFVDALVLLPFVLPTVVVGLAFTGLPGSVVAILAAHVFFNIA